jgi:hypothetical protein
MKKTDFYQPAYVRNQAELALWRVFLKRRRQNTEAVLPPVFKNRIKRFLDIDAKLFESAHAFVSEVADGSGGNRGFSLYDIFMLGLALDFSDAGYPQQDIVYLLQHCRKDLKRTFTLSMNYPAWTTSAHATESIPSAPVIIRKGGRSADPHMFLVVQKHEILEIYGKTSEPCLTVPMLFEGVTALTEFLKEDAGYREHHYFIIEYARLAVELREIIRSVPVRRRGRKAKTVGEV